MSCPTLSEMNIIRWILLIPFYHCVAAITGLLIILILWPLGGPSLIFKNGWFELISFLVGFGQLFLPTLLAPSYRFRTAVGLLLYSILLASLMIWSSLSSGEEISMSLGSEKHSVGLVFYIPVLAGLTLAFILIWKLYKNDNKTVQSTPES